MDLSLDELSTIDGIGSKRAKQIFEQFQLAKHRSFYQWLKALGFTGIHHNANQYRWQQISLWTHEDWRIFMDTSPYNAKQYSQLMQMADIKSMVNTLIKHQVNGFAPID